MKEQHLEFTEEALAMAAANIAEGGGPFAALVVLDGKIIGRGVNHVTTINDPTAHAEVMAIRDACRNLNHFKLENAVIYTSCEPCPMCLGAIYWARIKKIFYAASNTDAAKAGFDDSFIYKEIALPLEERSVPAFRVDTEKFFLPFQRWIDTESKVDY